MGLGLELELAVLRTTLAALPDLPGSISLSLNASPELVISGRLLDLIPLAHAGRLILEITEHAAVSSYTALQAQLRPLKRLGVRIAVDDAGAGYSGLQHIVQLGPDIIKMDMSLTRAIDTDPARRALARAMVFYAREMGACIVAEGIETALELSALQLLGAERGQRYLLGKPGSLACQLRADERRGSLGLERSRWRGWNGAVLSIDQVRGSEIIDGGDILVVRLTRPGEKQVPLLVPCNVAADLARMLLRDIEIARRQRHSTTPSP